MIETFTSRYGNPPYPVRSLYAALRFSFPPIQKECELCGQKRAGYLGKLVIDHCHQHGYIIDGQLWGYIRGYICGYDNRQIGRYEANIPMLGRGNKVYDDYINRCPDCAIESLLDTLGIGSD